MVRVRELVQARGLKGSLHVCCTTIGNYCGALKVVEVAVGIKGGSMYLFGNLFLVVGSFPWSSFSFSSCSFGSMPYVTAADKFSPAAKEV